MGCILGSSNADSVAEAGEILGKRIDWKVAPRQSYPDVLAVDPRDVDWDFVTVHLKNGENLPGSDWLSNPDAYVTCLVRAKSGAQVDSGVNKINKCTFSTKSNETSPTWDRIQMLCYDAKAGASREDFEVEVQLHDAGNVFWSDDLLATSVLPVPADGAGWQEHTIELKGGGKLNLALKAFKEPFITTEKDYVPLKLHEVELDSSTPEKPDAKASLAFRRKPGNTKMLLEIPGRCDSFTHPHLVQALMDRGYDYFHLAYRRVSRSRKWLSDERLTSHSEDFNEYIEDINKAIEFIDGTGVSYTRKVWMAHSTGGPIVLNYCLNSPQKDTPFTHMVLNSPFLDWGQIDAFSEFFMENGAEAISALAGGTTPVPGKDGQYKMNTWHFKAWATYRPHPDDRPIFVVPAVTSGWAKAVTAVHAQLEQDKGKAVSKPVFMITGESDDVLDHAETMNRAPWIGPNVETDLLKHNGHDVLCSATWEDTQEALKRIMAWLDKQEDK